MRSIMLSSSVKRGRSSVFSEAEVTGTFSLPARRRISRAYSARGARAVARCVKQAELTAVHQALDKAGERFRRGRGGNLILRQMDSAFPFAAVSSTRSTKSYEPTPYSHEERTITCLSVSSRTSFSPAYFALAVHRGRMGIVELTESLRPRRPPNTSSVEI